MWNDKERNRERKTSHEHNYTKAEWFNPVKEVVSSNHTKTLSINILFHFSSLDYIS